MPRNRYPEETKNKILDVATKLFLVKGYSKTTVLDIVAGLEGLTRGAFYHHFKSKEEVLGAILMRLNDLDSSIMQTGLIGKTGLDKLRAFMSLQKAFLDSPYKEALVLMFSLTKNPEFLVEYININKASAKEIQPFIEEGIADGSIANDVNPKLAAEFASVILNFWISPVYFSCTDDEFEEKAMFIKKALDGLGCSLFDEETLEDFLLMGKELNREVNKVLENKNFE